MCEAFPHENLRKLQSVTESVAPSANPDPNPAASAKRRRVHPGVVAIVAGLVVLLLLALTPSPYVIREPGPVANALGKAGPEGQEQEVISISGAKTYPSGVGQLTVMTVSVVGNPEHQLNWLELAGAWFDPTSDVLPMELYYPIGVSKEQRDEETAAMMTSSQDTSVAAALTYLGYDVKTQVVVAQVPEGSPATDKLQVGDVVLAYDDTPIHSLEDVQQMQLTTDPVRVRIRRDGDEKVVEVTPKQADDGQGNTRPLLGILVQEKHDFPIDVHISLADVGGPSAGLVFALATIDKLEPGSLTGGKSVAVTGAIAPDGTVSPIGGVRQKIFAASDNGADYFIAPEANCGEALSGGSAPRNMTVYAVADLSEAVDVLKGNAEGDTDGLRTCADAIADGVPQVQ